MSHTSKSDHKLQFIFYTLLTLFVTSCGGGSGNAEFEDKNTNSEPALGAANSGNELNPNLDNLPPEILATSLNCDFSFQHMSIKIGEISDFTLTVDDESPLTLSYSIENEDPKIAFADVDSNGIYSISGLQTGQTYHQITVTDGSGFRDNLELSVNVTER